MDVLHRRGRAAASEIHQALSDSPSYSAVRATLRVLEIEALRYVYLPTLVPDRAFARRQAYRPAGQ